MAIKARTKKWGNSIGVIIPAEIVERLGIKPNQELILDLKKSSSVLKEMFGKAKFRKDTDTIIKEVRRDM